ncbi:hypothetical protein GCM10022287_14140 [Gryllotalpicola koreensis]|uniref:Protein-glutamine gamma-glutamyltransferase-like C-terminal domain-containing protein n=1 Tax=Gryllotalpicola koreensis TaxID=993086 RepID=A0ABP7ZXE6_9MICO
MLGVVLIAAVSFGGVPHFGGPVWVPGQVAPPRQPAPTNTSTLPPSEPQLHGTDSVAGPLVLTVILLIAAAVLLWFMLRAVLRARGRGRTLPVLTAVEADAPPLPDDLGHDPDAEPDAPIVHRGLRLALDALDEQREPADAVVRAWLGLQSAAEDSGVERRPAETPTEFTARVITRVQADAGAAAQLVDVYQAVRFGGHPISSAEVRAARSAIERLLDSWHEPILRARR